MSVPRAELSVPRAELSVPRAMLTDVPRYRAVNELLRLDPSALADAELHSVAVELGLQLVTVEHAHAAATEELLARGLLGGGGARRHLRVVGDAG